MRCIVAEALGYLVQSTKIFIVGLVIWESIMVFLVMLPLVGLNDCLHLSSVVGFSPHTKVK